MQHIENNAANGARGALHPAPTPLAIDDGRTTPAPAPPLSPGALFLRNLQSCIEKKKNERYCTLARISCPAMFYCKRALRPNCYGFCDEDLLIIINRLADEFEKLQLNEPEYFYQYLETALYKLAQQMRTRRKKLRKEFKGIQPPEKASPDFAAMDTLTRAVMNGMDGPYRDETLEGIVKLLKIKIYDAQKKDIRDSNRFHNRMDPNYRVGGRSHKKHSVDEKNDTPGNDEQSAADEFDDAPMEPERPPDDEPENENSDYMPEYDAAQDADDIEGRQRDTKPDWSDAADFNDWQQQMKESGNAETLDENSARLMQRIKKLAGTDLAKRSRRLPRMIAVIIKDYCRRGHEQLTYEEAAGIFTAIREGKPLAANKKRNKWLIGVLESMTGMKIKEMTETLQKHFPKPGMHFTAGDVQKLHSRGKNDLRKTANDE